MKNYLVSILTLFGSLGTLICCALPAALVALGAGSVVISIFANVPSLLWLAEHKIALFCFAGIMLVITYFLLHRQSSCPIDEKKKEACIKVKKYNKAIFYISIGFYAIGFFMSFIASKLI